MAHLQTTGKRETLSPKIILVVDDDLDISQVLKSLLEERESYQVMLATNGFQALNLVRNVKPDLFLFDYRLPGMDGMELYHLLHADRALMDIPVLFLSANASRDLFEKEHLPYLKKPFELEDVFHKVETLLPG